MGPGDANTMFFHLRHTHVVVFWFVHEYLHEDIVGKYVGHFQALQCKTTLGFASSSSRYGEHNDLDSAEDVLRPLWPTLSDAC